jgi:arylformamidase
MSIPQKYIYLSYFMDAFTPLYGGGKGVSVVPDRSIGNGDTANTKQLALLNHSGTHIDYPNHFFAEGLTSESYEASQWIFNRPCLVQKNGLANEIIDLTYEELAHVPKDTDFLILKTGFGEFRSEEKYWKYNPGLSPNLARTLRKHFPALRVIGMDLLSITSFQKRELGREAHRKFLGGDRPILLIEDMDLSKLTSSPKAIMCLPLMIKGLDGSPVTIIATI